MKYLPLLIVFVVVALTAIMSWRFLAERGAVSSITESPMNTEGLEKAYFAGGCFWGVEYQLGLLEGVREVRSGYMGGTTENPTYHDVSSGTTGYAETVEVLFNSEQIAFRDIAKRFFEIHDPTELDRQGPDIGPQYRSSVFYVSEEQKRTTEELVGILRDRGYDVQTEIVPAGIFYTAEDYHQGYYEKSGGTPYCHTPVDRFGDS
ncbi:MAG: peptide-methionine (S)-S-oxide reductase MsrA [Candidatus Moranbacteria bacterium]|nr:peptide-methionine (S)-S-oxide reductase MsrA [Candidatus Moranbacteria bacterium]